LENMEVPKVILPGDWSCPFGHFNTKSSGTCKRCMRGEGTWQMARTALVVARDKSSTEALRSLLQSKKLERDLSRPSSHEAVAEAIAAAELSVDEVIDARDAESDRGIPAPERADKTAEQQTALLGAMVEQASQGRANSRREPDSSERIAGEEGSASVRIAESSARQPSEAGSFKTVTGSQRSEAASDDGQLTRLEKRTLRIEKHRQSAPSIRVYLTKEGHAKREQIAGMLNTDRVILEALPEPDINRIHNLLVTQNVSLLLGGPVCVTKLMGSMEMEFAEQDGVKGTILRLTVASQAEVFIASRDSRVLEEKKAEYAGELLDKAVDAVAGISWKDSAEHKALRAMLKGSQKVANLLKAPGIKDLELVGFTGDPAERQLRSSMALGQALKDPKSGFSQLEERPEEPDSESKERRARVREYTQEAFAALGLSMSAPPPPPPPPPPEWPLLVNETGRAGERQDSGARGSTEARAEPDKAGELTWQDRAKVNWKWSSYWTSPLDMSLIPSCEEWNFHLGTPPFHREAVVAGV